MPRGALQAPRGVAHLQHAVHGPPGAEPDEGGGEAKGDVQGGGGHEAAGQQHGGRGAGPQHARHKLAAGRGDGGGRGEADKRSWRVARRWRSHGASARDAALECAAPARRQAASSTAHARAGARQTSCRGHRRGRCSNTQTAHLARLASILGGPQAGGAARGAEAVSRSGGLQGSVSCGGKLQGPAFMLSAPESVGDREDGGHGADLGHANGQQRVSHLR